MGEFGPWHLLIVAAVFVVLFGAKKLPDAARSLGKSARILKTELKGLHDDDNNDDAAAKQIAALQAAQAVPPPAPVAAPAAPPVVVTEAPVQQAASADRPPAS